MTDKTIRALRIIKDHVITMPSQFGWFYFGADHPGWKKHGKSGNGIAAGVGLRLASGAFLGKLVKRGYIRTGYGGQNYERCYVLTKEGEMVLNNDI